MVSLSLSLLSTLSLSSSSSALIRENLPTDGGEEKYRERNGRKKEISRLCAFDQVSRVVSVV